MSEPTYTIISRAEALDQGLSRYFTGIPCKHGHICERITKSQICWDCHVINTKKYYRRNKQKMLEWHKKHYEENKEQITAYAATWYEENKEERRRKYKEYYYTNREQRSKYNKEWRERNKEHCRQRDISYYKQNKEKIAAFEREWRKSNPQKINRYINDRRARKLNATPNWLNEQHNSEIESIYKECYEISQQTGIIHHVDHIVPLRGKKVCGLHVPWNLQILEGSENISKSNKFDL